jgi:hypothetical protein
VASVVALGDATANASAVAEVLGLSSLAALGQVVTQEGNDQNIPVTGVRSQVRVGAVTVRADMSVPVTGVRSIVIGQTPTIVVSENISVNVTGVASSVVLGVATVLAGLVAYVNGVRAVGRVGQVTIQGAVTTFYVLLNGIKVDPNGIVQVTLTPNPLPDDVVIVPGGTAVRNDGTMYYRGGQGIFLDAEFINGSLHGHDGVRFALTGTPTRWVKGFGLNNQGVQIVAQEGTPQLHINGFGVDNQGRLCVHVVP